MMVLSVELMLFASASEKQKPDIACCIIDDWIVGLRSTCRRRYPGAYMTFLRFAEWNSKNSTAGQNLAYLNVCVWFKVAIKLPHSSLRTQAKIKGRQISISQTYGLIFALISRTDLCFVKLLFVLSCKMRNKEVVKVQSSPSVSLLVTSKTRDQVFAN